MARPTAGAEGEGNCCPLCSRDTAGPSSSKWTDRSSGQDINWTIKSNCEYGVPIGSTKGPRLTSRGAATRERIVAGAAALIYEGGVASTSLDKIIVGRETELRELRTWEGCNAGATTWSRAPGRPGKSAGAPSARWPAN